MTFASKEEYEKQIEAIKNVTSFIDYFQMKMSYLAVGSQALLHFHI